MKIDDLIGIRFVAKKIIKIFRNSIGILFAISSLIAMFIYLQQYK